MNPVLAYCFRRTLTEHENSVIGLVGEVQFAMLAINEAESVLMIGLSEVLKWASCMMKYGYLGKSHERLAERQWKSPAYLGTPGLPPREPRMKRQLGGLALPNRSKV